MHAPRWGATPDLLAEPEQIIATRDRVEIRPRAPRHLVECYDIDRVRCTQADALGFRHPAVNALIVELLRVGPRVEALFAGSIIEMVPTTEEIAPGQRIPRALLTDIYRFDDVDLRGDHFATRRELLERLCAMFDASRVACAPLLHVRDSAARTSGVALPDTIAIVSR